MKHNHSLLFLLSALSLVSGCALFINKPEVNTELSPEAFTPHLDSLANYQLSAPQGHQ